MLSTPEQGQHSKICLWVTRIPGHTMKFWALWKRAAKQMKELHFIDQIWLLRGKTPVLTSLGPLWICTGERKRRLWSSEFRRKGTRVNKKDFLANSRMPSSYLVEASGQDQSELLICSQNIFGVVNEVSRPSACYHEDFLQSSQIQRTKGTKGLTRPDLPPWLPYPM